MGRYVGATPRRAVLACGLLVLNGAARPSARAAGVPDTGATLAITLIAFDRHCFGCADEATLVLQRDGRVTRTRPGSERAATRDVVSTAVVGRAEFDALARLIAAHGFFTFADVYDDPDIRDGPWTTIRVAGDGRSKSVFRRDEAGPPALKAIEAAIESLAAGLRFAAVRT